MFLNWDESLSVNVKAIDDQHKQLVKMINEFYGAIRKDNKQALGKLLSSLAAYTVTHFAYEEKYFTKFAYPEAVKHKKQHQMFVDKVTDVKTRFDAGKLVISMEITGLLKDWLVAHIKGEDKKYTKWFNDRGLK